MASLNEFVSPGISQIKLMAAYLRALTAVGAAALCCKSGLTVATVAHS